MKFIHYTKRRSSPHGYIALLSVIIIGVIGTSAMLSVIFAGISATKTDITVEQGGQARFLASSCGEEALQKILETSTTSSQGSLSLGGNTCSYSITSGSGQSLVINALGAVGTLTSKVLIIVATTSPSLVVSSWQEVGDF